MQFDHGVAISEWARRNSECSSLVVSSHVKREKQRYTKEDVITMGNRTLAFRFDFSVRPETE
jgi:hypothetical protein